MVRFFYLFVGFLAINACQEQKPESWPMHVIDNTSKGADGTKLFDANGDGLLDIVTGWEQGNIGRLYFNPGNPKESWKYVEVNAPNVEDALAVDLDDDGFVDMVTCSEGNYMRISFHWGPSDTAAYMFSDQWETVDVPVTIGKTAWMFAQPMDVDGQNGIDLIVGSKDPNGTLGWLESPANPRDISSWQFHEISPANWIMSIEILDFDRDGLSDVLISDRNGINRGVRWLQNPGPTAGSLRNTWTNHIIGMTDAEPLFLGLNHFGQQRYIEIWSPNIERYFMRFRQEDSLALTWGSEKWKIPEMAGLIGKSAVVGDIDNDNNPDLVTTYDHAEDRSGVIWSSYDSTENRWTHHDISGPKGIKYDFAKLLDLDGDGDLDVLTSEEANNSQFGPGLGIVWYENPSIIAEKVGLVSSPPDHWSYFNELKPLFK